MPVLAAGVDTNVDPHLPASPWAEAVPALPARRERPPSDALRRRGDVQGAGLQEKVLDPKFAGSRPEEALKRTSSYSFRWGNFAS
jgi:hypothetical protein